ncbi:MAG: disulfide bond formation protein B [Pseudomonadota bacterium]
MLANLSSRLVFAGLALLAAVAMGFALLFLENVLNLEACPLCMSQRVFVVLWGVVALLAAVHNPGTMGRRIYAGLCGLSAFVGALIAARHTWLQHLPEDQVPACGPSLEFLLENFPLQEAISTMLMGDGNCAEIDWTLLSLSIPEQTLLLFCFVMLICLWQGIRRLPEGH